MKPIIYFVLLALVASCGTKKATRDMGAPVPLSSVKKELRTQEIPSEWMYCTGRLKVNASDFAGSGTFRMYVQKDRAIWIQLTKFGFEIGRAMITVDSIKAINKLQATYIAAPIEDLSNLYGANISLQEMQNIVWNIPPIRSKRPSISPQPNFFIVQGADESGQKSYNYKIGPPFQLLEGKISQSNAQAAYGLAFKNNDFQNLTNKVLFPYLRLYEIKSAKEALTIEMKMNDVVLDKAKNLRLDIPTSYTPVEL